MAFEHDLSDATLLKLLSFLFWGWSYLWCSNEIPQRDPEWYSRVVTLLHGSVATLAGLKQCDIMSLSTSKLTTKITIGHYALMLWSWGYFAFDLLWCIIYCPRNYVMLFHHATALIGVNAYMGKDYTGCTFACTLALMEITNPLLQTRWTTKRQRYMKACPPVMIESLTWLSPMVETKTIESRKQFTSAKMLRWLTQIKSTLYLQRFLREGGYRESILYYLVEFAYFFTFLSLRGVLCTYLIYKILLSDYFDMDEKLISLALYVVSIALIVEIVGYITYKYKGNVEILRWFANELNSIF